MKKTTTGKTSVKEQSKEELQFRKSLINSIIKAVKKNPPELNREDAIRAEKILKEQIQVIQQELKKRNRKENPEKPEKVKLELDSAKLTGIIPR